MKSHLETLFAQQIALMGHHPRREYRFHPTRKWRFDFAEPDAKIAAEIEGGTWSNGRHVRGSGFERDCEKYNQAALLGWRVFRFTGRMVEDGLAAEIWDAAMERGK